MEENRITVRQLRMMILGDKTTGNLPRFQALVDGFPPSPVNVLEKRRLHHYHRH